jgi:hypothetical protein
MFARPNPTTASPAYRSTTSLPTQGGVRLDSTAARPHRLDARRDGYAERTVITSDGVRLAVRDYGSAGARDHTVVLLHGLCLTQTRCVGGVAAYESSPTITAATAIRPVQKWTPTGSTDSLLTSPRCWPF